MKLALLGAESTGKTQLGKELAAQMRSEGRRVELVGEVLRDWCAREGRTPRPDEQAAIAVEQARLIDVAAATAEVTIADTTPLMTAIYSDYLFADRSLYAQALAHQRSHTVTLVTGLDLPWTPDGLQRDGEHVRAPVDALLRAALADAAIPYRVVYGSGPQRLRHALLAIDSIAPDVQSTGTTARFGTKWQWVCDKCSDPDCEHRLFTSCLAARG